MRARGLALALIRIVATMWPWVALAVGISLHLYLRAAADDIGGAPVRLAGIEESIFRGVPSVWLQRWLTRSAFVQWPAVVLHASWFYVPFFIAILVQVRSGTAAVTRLLGQTLVLLFIADAVFILLPTRPPWMDIELTRTVDVAYGDSTSVDPNPVAALPSLHVAIPMLYVLWMTFQHDALLRRAAPVGALWAAGVAWSVIYGGEHYVIDAMAGAALAAAVYACSAGIGRLASRRRVAATPLPVELTRPARAA